MPYASRERRPLPLSQGRLTFLTSDTLGVREPDAFDYVVMDEFHNADAPTYGKVIDLFTPKFRLGLTATPVRTDGGDLRGELDLPARRLRMHPPRPAVPVSLPWRPGRGGRSRHPRAQYPPG